MYKVNNRGRFGVLLLTLNIFGTFCKCFYTWLWTSTCWLLSNLLCNKDTDLNALIISRWRSLSYRNHSSDLFCKSVDWFLYDRDLCHKRIKAFHSSEVIFFLPVEIFVVLHTHYLVKKNQEKRLANGCSYLPALL